jgi:hypothetical protein
VAALAVAAGAPADAGAATARPLVTAITDAGYAGAADDVAFAHTRAAGATAVRLYVSWRGIAPGGSSKPAGFDASNPAAPEYSWSFLDGQIRRAVAHGLDPIISLDEAPVWAQGGTPENVFLDGGVRPNPEELGAFATAMATRYSGRFGGLPRVRYYQVWSEPNLGYNLMPQYDQPWSSPVTASSRPVAQDIYVPLVNAFAAAARRVHRDNVIIAGGLAPFGRFGASDQGVQPMIFMRKMFCLTSRDRPEPGCNRRSQLDVWGQDPYTAGGPQHRASVRGNVSIGNLAEVKRTLTAAAKAGRIGSNGPVRFWVMEFGWNTNPPFAQGVPLSLHARWVAESLYRMWLDGVTLVTWFQLRDDASYVPSSKFQSGLYFRCAGGIACDKPKPALTAFRFPFVAFKVGGKVLVWGRTPAGKRGTVTIQQRSGGSWRRLARLRTDRYGIFTARLTRRGAGDLRSALGGTKSLPFSLHRPPDRVVNPAL